MCGIFMYWARESTIAPDIYERMILDAEKRGQNGYGFAIIKPDGHVYDYKSLVPFSKDPQRKNIIRSIKDNLCMGDILLGVCRATPETEPPSLSKNDLQPIIYSDRYVLAHNGSVTRSDVARYSPKFRISNIDSETIIQAYGENDCNMKKTMESLSGSFAFIFIDLKKRQMYSVVSFNPLVHAYVKGMGYFTHSDMKAVERGLYGMTGFNKDGCNVWEYWYHSEIPPYTIITTDLDSGMQGRTQFKPKFIYPGWNNVTAQYEKVLVSASGGIDSSLTAFVLDQCGYSVELVHFLYGQKSQDAELIMVQEFSDKTNIPIKVIDLTEFYRSDVIKEVSMLTNEHIPVTTGGEHMKSSLAWVPGRNMMFLTHLATFAEALLMSNECSKVYIAAGWSQLTEETGGYPDNSARFVNSFFKMVQFGTLFGQQMEFMQVMANITKTEQWVLGDALGFPFHLTCSCDEPKVLTGGIFLCEECGSTKLSHWAALRAGVKDPRKFYRRTEGPLPGHIPEDLSVMPSDIYGIVDRLQLSFAEKGKLIRIIKKNKKLS
jgi:7-cyano-7-deazaguanine synthase